MVSETKRSIQLGKKNQSLWESLFLFLILKEGGGRALSVFIGWGKEPKQMMKLMSQERDGQ